MTDKDFAELLYRFENGLCTPEERFRLEKWLDGMREEGVPFRSFEEKKLTKAALRESILEKAKVYRAKSRPLFSFTWAKIAASVLILALGCYAILKLDYSGSGELELAVETHAPGEIQKVLLSDGSIVWLKGDSRLSYPQAFSGGERVVRLAGEGLFEVAKDPKRPFIIHTGDLTTRVLGTSFNIKSTPDETEVYVFTGRVSVSLAKTNQKIELLPKERIMYSHSSNKLKKKEQTTAGALSEQYTNGTEYNMYFQDTKVSDIAMRIASKFNVDVRFEGDLRSCVLTADFTDQSLSSTLDMISEALNAKYKVEGASVTLIGNGCQ